MVEFIVDVGERDERLAVAVGLSMAFRQSLVETRPSREAVEAAKRAVWGALLISPCPPGLPCFKDLEKAIDHSEIYTTPVGYGGPTPKVNTRRVATFNRHYMSPWRWAVGGEGVEVGHPLLPLMACIYRLLKTTDLAPVVISDVRLQPTSPAQPDYMVIPTWHMPREVAEVVDVYLPPLKASALALGVLMGGYKAGPVVAIVKRRDALVPQIVERGGYVVVLEEGGDPCRLFTSGVVGYSYDKRKYVVDPTLCDKCGDCLKTACPAIVFTKHPEIQPTCTGCGACAVVCTRGAIY